MCVACIAVAFGARAGEESSARWDDPDDSDADLARWERVWLDEHRRRTDFAALRAEGISDISALDTRRSPDTPVRQPPDAGMYGCDVQRETGRRPRDADARECFPSIFDSYYSERLPVIGPTAAPPFGDDPARREGGPVADPGPVGVIANSSDDDISIPDAGLRAAIAARLRKGQDDPITEADMARLTTLTAAGRGIVDLSGLRFATRMQRLNLGRNDISDLAELAGLTELTHLYVHENLVVDIAPLRDLSKLRSLNLSNNAVWDLWPLAGLTELRNLDLGHNDISSVFPLRSLRSLSHLYLNNNFFGSLWSLENLLNLRVLDLRNNEIEFVSPISALSRLTTLYLSENRISDISWLSGLANLRRLSLGGNQIDDISALAGMGKLSHLDLSRNTVADISPLAALSDLTLLGLADNQIADLSALANLSNLALLDLARNGVADVSALSGLTHLAALDLAVNRVADLSPLSDLTALTALDLTVNAIEDIAPLSGLGTLDTLYLGGNQIADASPLSGLTDLAGLSLTGNRLVDISPLRGLANLRHLSVSHNAVEQLPDLSRLHRLSHLWLYESMISDIQALSRLTRLRYLSAGGNSIADLRPVSTLERLESLYVSENEIDDLSPLARLSKLHVVYASDNTIEDLSPLTSLTRLTRLSLINNSVVDLSPLSGLSRLSWLWLRGNEVADVAPLVANADFAAGDYVNLTENPLDAQSINEEIPALVDRGVVVRWTAPPDLVVDSPSVSDEDLETGASFTLSATVRNQGDAEAASTTLRYYRSSDSTIATSDSEVGTDPVTSLSGSETSAESIRLTAPSSAGTYYYGACVDAVEKETDTDNNCSSGVRVTVRSGGGGGDDHSDTRSGATPLSLGGSQSGRIETSSDVDYFRVRVSRSGTLTVYSTGSLDAEGELQDSSGNVLASNSDGGSGTNFRIEHSVSAGTYYVKVEGWRTRTGDYTVHADFEEGSGGGGGGGGGTDSYCRDDDVIDPGDRCDIYSTDEYFEVLSDGRVWIPTAQGYVNIRSRIRVDRNSIRFHANPVGSLSWTIVDVEPEPEN